MFFSIGKPTVLCLLVMLLGCFGTSFPLHLPVDDASYGLAFADGMKQMAHALMMIFLIWRWGGRLGHGVWRTALIATGASALMGVVLYFSANAIMARMGTAGLIPRLTVLIVPGILGGILYYLILRWMKVPEVNLLHRMMGR
ncbi:MAG: hypothetical protein DSY57_03985, partial [Desulfobulbus sp.]